MALTDSQKLDVVVKTVTEWDHLFSGNKDMGITGVFERIFTKQDEMSETISGLPCQGTKGCNIVPKIKAKQKAKEWGPPIGLIMAAFVAVGEWWARRGG